MLPYSPASHSHKTSFQYNFPTPTRPARFLTCLPPSESPTRQQERTLYTPRSRGHRNYMGANTCFQGQSGPGTWDVVIQPQSSFVSWISREHLSCSGLVRFIDEVLGPTLLKAISSTVHPTKPLADISTPPFPRFRSAKNAREFTTADLHPHPPTKRENAGLTPIETCGEYAPCSMLLSVQELGGRHDEFPSPSSAPDFSTHVKPGEIHAFSTRLGLVRVLVLEQQRIMNLVESCVVHFVPLTPRVLRHLP
ncbi:hypothetical protein BDZ94DRAFT_1234107 [Collybia nuda]|uniref:Uncharacterized protein n=1 Tax=Collybia nuda TaxID=64659 RepID=A0A9P5YA22_9AGAR|nr:hypothetical protein BDZ94DRAFT_1234107 [Collybia nuda]